jgi:hypothetical protein
LKEKLQESYKDFEMLSIDWNRIDKLLKSTAGGEIDGLRSQAALTIRLKEKLSHLKNRHEDDIKKMKILENSLEQKESELIDLQRRVEGYENGTTLNKIH